MGERGIPLSPDTLVLPTSVANLPQSVIDAAMVVLGEGWSIANAPAGTLPAGVIRTFDEGAVLTIKDLLTLMIIVSDNTATDVMFAKVGGTEPVNQLIKTYGLNTIRATGTAEAWFKARDAYIQTDLNS